MSMMSKKEQEEQYLRYIGQDGQRELVKYCMRYVGDDAEDIAHDVFLGAIYDKWQEVRQRGFRF
jgi:DNA-directed RNA polymerase specialized sigma24 family protein